VFNARGLVCGCVDRARKFTPMARVMFLERRRRKTHMTKNWINTARCKHARAIGLREVRGPTWPLGTHHVDDGGVLECLGMCLCHPHPPPTWHMSGIRLGNQYEWKISKYISTNPAQIASRGEPNLTGVAWHCDSTFPDE
jgi:hypothetical protein